MCKQGMTTIKDVAAHAQVGVGTVSRVINDHPAVTAEMRARVRAAIEVLDYEPNRAARPKVPDRLIDDGDVVPIKHARDAGGLVLGQLRRVGFRR